MSIDWALLWKANEKAAGWWCFSARDKYLPYLRHQSVSERILGRVSEDATPPSTLLKVSFPSASRHNARAKLHNQERLSVICLFTVRVECASNLPALTLSLFWARNAKKNCSKPSTLIWQCKWGGSSDRWCRPDSRGSTFINRRAVFVSAFGSSAFCTHAHNTARAYIIMIV